MNARLKEMPQAAQEREVKLFRNGRNQAVRIPVEFELPGNEAVMRKEGDRLILEPKHRKMGLAALLATFEPWEGDFPELDETQPPPEEVDL
ncbi:antitoxin [Shinella sp. BYT-45]|uniref:antitoxin n=1 Tax=Shinella sp. BYT-45 TaxID=3377377 RepID=UPI00397FBC16